ncbi:MAG: phosphoethanolamine transferase [Brachymonas sp.]
MKKLFARPFGALSLLVICSVWLATLGNLPLWRELGRLGQLQNTSGWLLALGLGLVIFSTTVLLGALLAWRKTVKPLLTLLLLLAAFASYYEWQFGVVIDPTMVTNVLQTDVREARDVLSGQLFLFVAGIALLPMIWLWRLPLAPAPSCWRGLVQRLGLMLVALAVLVASLLAVYQPLASLMRNHTQVRYLMNPLNSIWATGVVTARHLQTPKHLQSIGLDAVWTGQAGAKPKILLLVVGETARSANFQLNGYGRATNPLLSKRPDVLSFSQVASCGTSTAASLPCMFAQEGRSDYQSGGYEENLLDVLQRAGLAVLWLDNQSGCKGVCARVPTVSTSAAKDPAYCAGGECMDAIMISRLDAEIAKLPAERRAKGVVVVLHQMGSHGPAYFKRSPSAQKTFQPECQSTTLQDCPRQNIVNAYDNSIVYTDFVLNKAIDWLQSRADTARGAMLYVSDHGESLGENNLYLHGLPYAIAPDFQKHVPWIAWQRPDFGMDSNCLRQRRDVPISHDNLFHTVLGMMQVQTSVYDKSLDAYASCQRR